MLFQASTDKKFFALLAAAAGSIAQSADLFAEMTEHLDSVTDYAARMKDLESAGDRVHDELLHLLNSTFITPLEREDILALAEHLDDVTDGIEATASRLAIYGIANTDEHIRGFVRILRAQAAEVAAAVDRIGERKLNLVHENNVRIKALEKEADQILRDALVNLFDQGGDPLRVVKLKEIYEILESTTDRAQSVAETLESVVVKNA